MTRRLTVDGLRFTGILLWALFLFVFRTPYTVHGTPNQTDRIGVLVIAHGGTNQWDGMIRKAVKGAALDGPAEVALGMGMHPHEARVWQQAVNRLERKGVSRIVVVPLLISSHSEVYRQYEYLFGLRAEAEWKEVGKPLALEVPVALGRALDDSPVVAEILLERSRALSRHPEDETVILLAHGPNGDADNELWLATMQQMAQRVKREGRFREVLNFTMRDDAPKPIREQATDKLRAAVQASNRQGRVLVVPLLIARGGVERKIPGLLAGLSYVWKGETLLPHPKLVQWIAQQAAQLADTATPQVDAEHFSTVSSSR